MEPTSTGLVTIQAMDGEEIAVVAGSSFKLNDSDLVMVAMTQEQFNESQGGVPQSSCLNALAERIHAWAKVKGWWDEGHHRTFGDLIALCHSELSEALEEYRDGHAPDESYHSGESHPEVSLSVAVRSYHWKLKGIPSELADTIIRILDMCGYYGIDIDDVMNLKMDYNDGREFRHGGRVL